MITRLRTFSAVALLLACLFAFGFWPRLLTDKITPNAEKVVSGCKMQVTGFQPSDVAKTQIVSIANRQSATKNP